MTTFAQAREACLKEFAALTRHEPEVLSKGFYFRLDQDAGSDEFTGTMSYGKRTHSFKFKGDVPAKEAARALYVSVG